MINLFHVLSLFCFWGYFVNGQTIFGFNNYTRLTMGNINIILSAPHEGYSRPDEIPDRTSDKLGNVLSDLRTSLIAEIVSEELTHLFSQIGIKATPFLIVNYLHR